jgi:1-phosphofructokinase/tagatose 6-phosphate kinase
MRAGLRAGPAVVAPNGAEAEEAVGHEFNEPDDLVLGLRELIEMGAGEAIITRDQGCVAQVGGREGRRCYAVTIEPLEQVTATVGSGDAFLAGYVAARYDGKPPAECLAYAVACGAESTRHIGAGIVDPKGVAELLEQVRVEELERVAIP